jgi:hypothetical protein
LIEERVHAPMDLWVRGRQGKRRTGKTGSRSNPYDGALPQAKWPGKPGHRACEGHIYLSVGPLEPPPPPIAPIDGIACRIGAGELRNDEILPTLAVLPAEEDPVGPPDLNTFKPPPPRPIT